MLDNIRKVYFLGIGGIGMSALARWFKLHDYEVAGYDLSPSSLTSELEQEGMEIHYQDQIDLIPPGFLEKPKELLVIYTPAIPQDHQEFNYFIQHSYHLKKRAEVLGMLTQNHFTIAVAGTHGKTTTTSLIAHILYNSKKSFAAFSGGIIMGHGKNLLMRQIPEKEMIMLVEADEYDKSFLHLSPDIAIVTSMDADHLDIYGNKKHLNLTFIEFLKKIKGGGRIFAKKDLALEKNLVDKTVKYAEYGIHDSVDCSSRKVRFENGKFIFEYLSKAKNIKNLSLTLAGYHNVENATAAISVALAIGIEEEDIRRALDSFQGVKRRFEYIVKNDTHIYIDDYAHHPEELKAFITSIRKMYPQKKVSAIFQPHLFSRTRDFADEFAQSLSLADEVMLLEIYPAREKEIPGVSADLIYQKITSAEKRLLGKAESLEHIKETKENLEIILTIGAGDIGLMTEPIKKILTG